MKCAYYTHIAFSTNKRMLSSTYFSQINKFHSKGRISMDGSYSFFLYGRKKKKKKEKKKENRLETQNAKLNPEKCRLP